ncbi:MAG: GAF domain-containing protein [Elusimicrobia bacterium]|jgi:GAF domain-containing protein|nr:GAF domain-containing protein [Elusimicrobiota bacterium]
MEESRKLRIPDIALLKWQNIADLLAQVAAVPAATVNIVEDNSLRVIGASQGGEAGAKDTRIEMRPGLKIYCAAVIQTREKLLIPDATKSDFWRESEGAKAGFIAYVGVPIFNPDGDIFGSICLFDRKPNKFEGPILRLMEEFSEIITGHIQIITKNLQLEDTLKEVRTLQGLIPICANCKKIRDDKGFWQKVEVYLEQRSNARFTHGLCEDCIQKLYGKEKWYKEKDQ